jgi:hypothetical protein
VPHLLVLNSEPWAWSRFRFDQYWTKIDGFLDVMRVAWGAYRVDADACHSLDQKLRALAKALRSWRATRIGNVRLQLATARAVIYELDVVQETRLMSPGELELRCELKANVLGLSSLVWTMARQSARIRGL